MAQQQKFWCGGSWGLPGQEVTVVLDLGAFVIVRLDSGEEFGCLPEELSDVTTGTDQS